MIIDVHGQLCASPKLYAWYALLLASGTNSVEPSQPQISDDEMLALPETRYALDVIRLAGIDLQVLSPRLFRMHYRETPSRIAHHWAEGVNAYLAQMCKVLPDQFAGMCALPRPTDEPITTSLPELERCVKEYGFIGCLLDANPSEGDKKTPPLGNEYWYPLYERLCELNVPARVQLTGNEQRRQTQSTHQPDDESLAILSLLNSRVYVDFPELKLIISHGGGLLPYQIADWRAQNRHPAVTRNGYLDETLEEGLKRLYYDTVLDSRDSLETLVGLVGSERVVFGTAYPGFATTANPHSGQPKGKMRAMVDESVKLTEQDRRNIYENNARSLFSRLSMEAEAR